MGSRVMGVDKAFDCLIGGRLISSAYEEVVNPAAGQVFARRGVADRTLIRKAYRT